MDNLDGNCFAKMKDGSDDEEDTSLINNNNNITPASEARMSVQKDDLYYKMNHKNRGLAYIFNHQKFVECPERHGTKEDVHLLTKTLSSLNFQVNLFHDLTESEVQEQINKAARFNHDNYDCFLVAFLTHGNEGQLWAKNKAYDLQKIFDKFTADMCPTLAGKPKIFLLQACQGTAFDPGITLTRRTETDGHERYRIPVRADFLIIYASFSGYYAFRNNEKGSYFVYVLCDELQKRGTIENILVILTLVNQRVAVNFVSSNQDKDVDNKKQMPYFKSSLTRLLKFTN